MKNVVYTDSININSSVVVVVSSVNPFCIQDLRSYGTNANEKGDGRKANEL